jgi:molybdopterin molybdotransferase
VLTPAQAEEQIAHHLPSLPIESLPVSQCAGAVLRENVYAERDQPPFDRVAMDGIAIATSGGRRLRVQGTQAAGDAPLTLESPRHCIEVMTGAMLPALCDAVVPVERIRIVEGEAEIEADLPLQPGLNVHQRASDLKRRWLRLPVRAWRGCASASSPRSW